MILSELSKEGRIEPPAPRVWVLADDRPGHRTQVVGLADALGWPYEVKDLRFTALNRISNRLLGASRLTLDRARSAALAPPWPDLAIAMGRRSAPIARWIGKQSGGRTRLVQLGRKGANVAGPFDLAITCAHFRLPAHPRRVETLLPLTQVTPDRLAAAAAQWPGLFDAAARPRIMLLVGGTTAQHRLPPATARRMASDVAAFAEENGGSLTIVTSRRTGAAAEAALRQGAASATLHGWRRDEKENPYLGYLALADVLVVTGDSESMLAEAAAAGKPLFIHPIPKKPLSFRARIAAAVLRASRGGPAEGGRTPLIRRICAGLIESGAVLPPRDLDRLHRDMAEAGVARFFGEPLEAAPVEPEDHNEQVLRRVRALVGIPPGANAG
jgi:mitochondrial fission protein ELM1